ncbi:hypothetical protein [Bacillus pseudomycoides]|uniref:hypothetical protein n=1 Tax=Bacillus pseudomycoides TaxID=64104 RepID=UPI000BF20603|nr:hypothetical protein [Bacillus pseudomycoides]PEN09681.1 hypothetical protein CN640_11570 [Bacillus pseudomycoides]
MKQLVELGQSLVKKYIEENGREPKQINMSKNDYDYLEAKDKEMFSNRDNIDYTFLGLKINIDSSIEEGNLSVE